MRPAKAGSEVVSVESARLEEEAGELLAGDELPLLPPGKYSALCISAKRERFSLYKRTSVVIRFRILGGPHHGVMVARYLPVDGSRLVGRSSSFYREWSVANGQTPRRRSRRSLTIFLGKVFLVEVGTVERGHDGRCLGVTSYSVVRRILEHQAGAGRVSDS